jgi:hypothetical protein
MPERTIQLTITVPKVAHAIRGLANVAARHGLSFKVLWDDRGWWFHTFRAEVSGEDLYVGCFKTAVQRVVAEYNQ